MHQSGTATTSPPPRHPAALALPSFDLTFTPSPISTHTLPYCSLPTCLLTLTPCMLLQDLSFRSQFSLRVKRNDFCHAFVAYFECAFSQVGVTNFLLCLCYLPNWFLMTRFTNLWCFQPHLKRNTLTGSRLCSTSALLSPSAPTMKFMAKSVVLPTTRIPEIWIFPSGMPSRIDTKMCHANKSLDCARCS